jgi:cytosine/adenosine deaminase-related metal-dependent hydrolase
MPRASFAARSSLGFTAKYVFPVERPPIENGAVLVRGDRIVDTGRRRDFDPGVLTDLGNVALLPGLVNAHTHLEFSFRGKPVGSRGTPLPEWIPQLVAVRKESEEKRADAVKQGLEESAALGVTALGEIAQIGWPWQAVGPSDPRVLSFVELIAPTQSAMPQASAMVGSHTLRAPARGDVKAGLGPHAPYTVHPDLLQLTVDMSRRRRMPVSMHVAESPEELQFLRTADGPIREMLEKLDAWEPSAHAADRKPLDILKGLKPARRVVVVHGNYLDDEEIAFLAENRRNMTVVYCPRTHAFFKHAKYPLEKMLAAGTRVALGTDSKASVPDLSMLAEMRHVARSFRKLPGETVLQLGTLAAAEALGWQLHLGSLAQGKFADMVAVQLPDDATGDPHDLLLRNDLPIVGVWKAGERIRGEGSGA